MVSHLSRTELPYCVTELGRSLTWLGVRVETMYLNVASLPGSRLLSSDSDASQTSESEQRLITTELANKRAPDEELMAS